jgi:hypothetical protein
MFPKVSWKWPSWHDMRYVLLRLQKKDDASVHIYQQPGYIWFSTTTQAAAAAAAAVTTHHSILLAVYQPFTIY